MRRLARRGSAALLAVAVAAAAGVRADAKTGGDADVASVADYYDELERLGLVDIDTGSREALRKELDAAEALLQAGSPVDAAIALFGIVESPRFRDFSDFVEYQNAEYYLGVALMASGAYDSALVYFERAIGRGPSTLYFAPAHRRAVDIALETRTYAAVLAMLDGIKLNEPIPPGAAGERAYLRARIAYERGDFAAAEGELVKISRKSRLYSSSLYMRGVIRTRRGEFQDATDAFCEVVATPDSDKYTFVVDDRYFTIKDLARLGLGRVAHEEARYDDAYYHYFQIPDDSDRLPEALFEAGWSMYQKRELATARDLVAEFLRNFPDSPLAPEAMLLAGYIELADCQFDDAQKYFDRIVAEIEPVVVEVDRTRKNEDRRHRLFDKALVRWRAERADPETRVKLAARTPRQKMLAYLRLDPKFVRLHDAIRGMRRAAGDAPHVVRSWRSLARRVARQQFRATSGEKSLEEEYAADAAALLEDVRRLRDEIGRARQEIRRGVRAGTLPEDAAREEMKRLDALEKDVDALETKAEAAARATDSALTAAAHPLVGAMIQKDLDHARALDAAATAYVAKLEAATDKLAVRALDTLYTDLRRVVDKAKLGKIDAVIGQKRVLDIEVTDLASGRYPPELVGKLWEQGLIGDDEMYWPYEGEYWKDEYSGWR